MGLFGRTSCREDRSWHVKAMFNNDKVRLTEQLNESEAKEFYEKLIKEVESNKSGFIRVKKDNGDEYTDQDFFINLAQVEQFELYSY